MAQPPSRQSKFRRDPPPPAPGVIVSVGANVSAGKEGPPSHEADTSQGRRQTSLSRCQLGLITANAKGRRVLNGRRERTRQKGESAFQCFDNRLQRGVTARARAVMDGPGATARGAGAAPSEGGGARLGPATPDPRTLFLSQTGLSAMFLSYAESSNGAGIAHCPGPSNVRARAHDGAHRSSCATAPATPHAAAGPRGSIPWRRSRRG